MAFSLSSRSKIRTIVGLDIEPGRAVAAEVSVNGVVRLTRAASIALPVGVVRDGEVVDIDAVSSALRQLWSEHKGLGRQVRIGVANAKIVVRTVDIPPLTDVLQIDAAVRHIAAEELPMPLESAVLDYETVGLVETAAGQRLRVVVVAARREMVESIIAAVTRAGLKPRGVDLSAFAMIRALGDGRSDSALYLSVGGMANLAVVVDGVCLFTRVTGAGLEGMGIELAERRGLTLEDARRWLRHTGLKDDVQDIEGDPDVIRDARSILSEGTRRLATDVRASLDFHQTQTAAAEIDHALLTGVAASLPGFADALASELQMPVQTRCVAAVDGLGASIDLGGVTIAAGLAVAQVGA
ncbi:MAG: type IV pilus assembly protein PilM [Solirubrobacterales bacterium]|nr:type IV pilus assembly protein PilM [Solirubrobacterales bacterium]